MMLVIADASPVNVLVRIQHIGVLPKLFGRIVIPPAVVRELSHSSAPRQVQDWIATCPAWVEVRAPLQVDASLPVDSGEREAISLARELRADLLLMDDRKARRAAQAHGLRVAATLAVLEEAGVQGLLDSRESLERLRTTDFSISNRLLREALDREERRQLGVTEPERAQEPKRRRRR